MLLDDPPTGVDRLDLVAGPSRAPLGQLPGGLQPLEVPVELGHHLVDPLAARGVLVGRDPGVVMPLLEEEPGGPSV